jgi:hypothetical protein
MAQVVDATNLVQLATTGSVPEFKAPETVKAPEAKADVSTAAKPSDAPAPGGEAKPADGAAKTDAGTGEPARDEKGQFIKAEDKAKGEAPKPDDDDDADLPERVRKQIGKKHRRMMEAEEFARERDQAAVREQRRAEAAERELERLRSGKSDGPKPGSSESVDPDEPKQGDFKTVGEYTRALVKYEAEKAGKQSKANAETSRQQERANATLVAFGERQDEFRKANPDYDDVVSAANLEVSPAMTTYLIESDLGPALMLHLSRNPEEVSRLGKLSPSRQVAELGKLEIKLEKKADPPPSKGDETKPTAREVSKAPAPIAPLEAKTTPVQKDPSQMSVSELRDHRRQEALAKQAR